jgi:hypothetical protein
MRNIPASQAALPHAPLHWAPFLEEGFRPHPWTITFCIQDEIIFREAWSRQGHGDIEDAFAIDFDVVRDRAMRFAQIVESARAGDKLALRLLGEFSPLFSRIGFPSGSVRNVARWFAKALLRDERRITDYRQMMLGRTGKHGDRIVSRSVLVSRRAQLTRQRKFVESAEVTTKTASGELLRIPFSEVCNTAEKRFAKAYVRLKGLEQRCVERRLAGFFVTLTLPPHFHPNPSVGQNSWDGASPLEGHAELQRRWRSFQRRFGKVWGVRVEEQHKDGCVHWHTLMFISPHREREFIDKIERYFGAEPATKIIRHDPAVAACATYFAKYMMKTTATTHLSDEDAKTCERADAHRATWGGRSMQFFDVPGSGTVWDELRRIKDPEIRLADLPPEIHSLHDAACSNDYARFLAGFAPMRAEKRISLVYGDRRGSIYLRGLEIDDVRIDTHVAEWTLNPGTAPASREAAVARRTLRHSYPSKAKDSAPAHGGSGAKRDAGVESHVDDARRAKSMRRGSEGMQSPRLTTFDRKCSEYPSRAKGAVADGRN